MTDDVFYVGNLNPHLMTDLKVESIVSEAQNSAGNNEGQGKILRDDEDTYISTLSIYTLYTLTI